MNRLLVAVLAAIDAVIAAAVGVAAALAPLTLFWVLGLGGTADWGALWPAAVRVWQLGHLVPLHITLGDDYLIATGIPFLGHGQHARFLKELHQISQRVAGVRRFGAGAGNAPVEALIGVFDKIGVKTGIDFFDIADAAEDVVRHRLVKEIVQAYDRFDADEQRREAQQKQQQRNRPIVMANQPPASNDGGSELPVNHEQAL